MQKKIVVIWAVIFFGLGTSLVLSQNVQTDIEELKKSAPRVFIDCASYNCDLDYIRTEITFVNYVREPEGAQVYVLITMQGTGGGGAEFTLAFSGQKEFKGMNDTLKYYSHATDTGDEIRRGLVRILKVGLIRYVAKTSIVERVAIGLTEMPKPTSVVDKWNLWVFSLSTSASFNGEKTYKSNSFNGAFTASRMTPQLKIYTGVSASQNISEFQIGDELIKSRTSSQSFSGLLAKGLGEHWSVGGGMSLGSSTYQNVRFSLSLYPAVEYNLFPYSQSTRRQLLFLYEVGYRTVRYREETIYDKTKHIQFRNDLS